MAASGGTTHKRPLALTAKQQRQPRLILAAALLLLAGAAGGAHAAFVGSLPISTPFMARRAALVMRAGSGPNSNNDSTTPEPAAASSPLLLSRGDWMQGLAGAAGIGAVAMGGQRAVRAAQEENEVLARRPVFAERLYDTRRKSYLPVDAYLLKSNKALDRPVICVGEVHDDDCHHFAEYSILKAVHARHVAQGGAGQLAVGLEMFYKQHQPILDDYVFGSGTRTLASLKEDTRWEETWGWKLAHYSKILNYARMHGIRVCGLNVPQPVVKVVSKMGLEKVPPELKRKLPDIDLNNKAHRESFMNTMRYFAAMHGGASGSKGAAGPHAGGMSEETLLRMYEAQTLWEEYMAASASTYIRDAGPGARMVVMAGSNHIQNRYGIPDRIARRLGVAPFTVVPISVAFDPVSGLPAVDEDSLREYLVPSYADWIYMLERAPEA